MSSAGVVSEVCPMSVNQECDSVYNEVNMHTAVVTSFEDGSFWMSRSAGILIGHFARLPELPGS